MTPNRKILLGLGLGILTGLLVGDDAGPLRFVADGFVRLLQMTVLPYVTVSLIAGIGGLDSATAKRLFLRVGGLTLVLWAMALGAVFLMPLAFPSLQSASFFSTTLVEERHSVDFLSLYIPSNPFHSLANSIVPAVVLFSGVVGIALMGVPGRERLIDWLKTAEQALARANRLVVRLTPYGLFAIAAHTAGTLDLEQAARLRVYLIAYGALALLLALWVFPGLVACLTPIPVRRVLQEQQGVLIAAFVTGDLFIVLPALIERSRTLLVEHGCPEPEEGSPPEVIVPAFYNFPHAAKMLSLSFVLFAAWFSETSLELADYPRLGAAGIVSLFGSINVAVPFLLDLVRVPADTFQLFLATGVINSRFGTLAAAMHMIVLALAGTYALEGRLQISPRRILRYVLVTAALTAATLAAIGLTLRTLGGGSYEGDRTAMQMSLLRPASEKATVLSALPEQPLEGSSVLERIRQRGKIRVGFILNQFPYSYFNSNGQLVGFDVEMAHALASELGVAVEFAPVSRTEFENALASDRIDVVMAGILLTTHRASRAEFSAPYLDETFAFLVRDHRRAEFSDAGRIRRATGLRIAMPDLPYMRQLIEREFPNATAVPIDMSTIERILRPGDGSVDAVCLTAERGSFLTLLRPEYSVAIPLPLEIRLPLAYPVAHRDLEMARFLSLWIDLKRKDRTIQDLYDHWILGKDARPKQPRWSVLHDVLGW